MRKGGPMTNLPNPCASTIATVGVGFCRYCNASLQAPSCISSPLLLLKGHKPPELPSPVLQPDTKVGQGTNENKPQGGLPAHPPGSQLNACTCTVGSELRECRHTPPEFPLCLGCGIEGSGEVCLLQILHSGPPGSGSCMSVMPVRVVCCCVLVNPLGLLCCDFVVPACVWLSRASRVEVSGLLDCSP